MDTDVDTGVDTEVDGDVEDGAVQKNEATCGAARTCRIGSRG